MAACASRALCTGAFSVEQQDTTRQLSLSLLLDGVAKFLQKLGVVLGGDAAATW